MGSKREKRWGQCAYSCRAAYFHPAEDIVAATLHNLPARITQRHRAAQHVPVVIHRARGRAFRHNVVGLHSMHVLRREHSLPVPLFNQVSSRIDQTQTFRTPSRPRGTPLQATVKPVVLQLGHRPVSLGPHQAILRIVAVNGSFQFSAKKPPCCRSGRSASQSHPPRCRRCRRAGPAHRR